jgi:hypothetical protein
MVQNDEASMTILQICVPVDSGRPQIDYSLLPNDVNRYDWDSVRAAMEQGSSAISYQPLQFHVADPRATQWDAYACGGLIGIVSERTRFLWKRFSGADFEFLPVALNSVPYWIPYPIRRLDCLDYEQSQISYFTHDPTKIKRIKHYAFREEEICGERLFVLPERNSKLFCTSSVRDAMQQIGLLGFTFIDTLTANNLY